MRIALLSDTHNNLHNIQSALSKLKELKVDTIIHCGDMTRDETAEAFHDFCIHHVLGNGDMDTFGLQMAIQECRPGSSSGEIYTATLDGKSIAAIHGHNLPLYRSLTENGRYDYVFHGHTHRLRDERIGKTRVINPGALGGAVRGERSFCVLELSTGDLSVYPVETRWSP